MTRRETLKLSLLVPTVWVGCTTTENKPTVKVEEPKIEPALSGKEAIYRIFPTARQWSRDIQVLRANSVLFAEYPHEAGKVGGWQVTFASPTMGKSRTYRWSNQEIGNKIKQGIFAGSVEDWAGPSGINQPFSPQSLIKDTEEIWKIVSEKKAKFIAANPTVPVSYEAGAQSGVPGLCWAVIFGSPLNPKSRVLVDVGTGKILKDK